VAILLSKTGTIRAGEESSMISKGEEIVEAELPQRR
jgi:hypothetical protein